MKRNLLKKLRCMPGKSWQGFKLFSFIIALALFQLSATAQENTKINKVAGQVKNAAGEPVAGATVHLKNSDKTTVTDPSGNFSIDAPADGILEFSFVGFRKQSIPVSGKTQLMIGLEQESNLMNDVVIVGYNSKKKAAINGAVSTVDMNSLSKTRIADVGQALQGQVPGVFVAANTGAPGDGIQIRIRGLGTLGNNDVLFVVDGVPTRDISFLN